MPFTNFLNFISFAQSIQKIDLMKNISTILRILVGLVFIFSGFVKAVDPVGTQIKFEDYFTAMGLDFMHPTALFWSFVLNAAEFGLGILLVLNVLPKPALWGALAFMILFTPLTFWLAVANPVTDCGCFGDAVKLTNWETFWKNVVLLAMIIVALRFGTHKSPYGALATWGIFGATALLVFGFQFYNYRHLPMIDFRPFYEGSDIKEKVIIPEDAPQDEYEIKLYYENLKSGEVKEFTLEDAPYDDSLAWAFDTTVSVLVKEGYRPPIHDFVLTDLEGNDRTMQILDNPSFSFILISFDFDKAKEAALKEVTRISDFAAQNGYLFYVFTASGGEAREAFIQNHEFEGIVCTGDKTMLKTIVRSNPAWVLMKDGTIVKKWHFRDLPDNAELSELTK